MLKKSDIKNIDLLIARKEIKKRFSAVLTDLRKTIERNGYAVQTIERFRGCLENPGGSEVSRLPLFSPTSFSLKHHHKIYCILCVISYGMQLYWALCAGDKKVIESLPGILDQLENYAAKGLAAFKIAGTRYPDGYYLVEI